MLRYYSLILLYGFCLIMLATGCGVAILYVAFGFMPVTILWGVIVGVAGLALLIGRINNLIEQ